MLRKKCTETLLLLVICFNADNICEGVKTLGGVHLSLKMVPESLFHYDGDVPTVRSA